MGSHQETIPQRQPASLATLTSPTKQFTFPNTHAYLPIPREHEQVVPRQGQARGVRLVRRRVEVGEEGGAELGELWRFWVVV